MEYDLLMDPAVTQRIHVTFGEVPDTELRFRMVQEFLDIPEHWQRCEPFCDGVSRMPTIPYPGYGKDENKKSFVACKHCGAVYRVIYIDTFGPPKKPVPVKRAIGDKVYREAQKGLEEWIKNTNLLPMMPDILRAKDEWLIDGQIPLKLTDDGYLVPHNANLDELIDGIPQAAIFIHILETKMYAVHRVASSHWAEGAKS